MAIPLYPGPQDNSDLHKLLNDLIVQFNATYGTAVALFGGAQNVNNFLDLLNIAINRMNVTGILSFLIPLVAGPQDVSTMLALINALGFVVVWGGGVLINVM